MLSVSLYTKKVRRPITANIKLWTVDNPNPDYDPNRNSKKSERQPGVPHGQ